MKEGHYLNQIDERSALATEQYNPTTIWNPMFISIFIVNLAMNFGQYMMNTLIPKFADSLGATPEVVGIVASMFTITALAVKPVSGPAIDTLPKKKDTLRCDPDDHDRVHYIQPGTKRDRYYYRKAYPRHRYGFYGIYMPGPCK